jgi:hypothetical protein
MEIKIEINNIPEFMSRSHISPMSIFDRILLENYMALNLIQILIII